MTAFVILAAGPGTRMGPAGDLLHKALLPLAGRAVISRQIALAPPAARIIVCTGHRAGQVRDYLDLAHPDREVACVSVNGWNRPGGGPGASLLAARTQAGDDDLIVTSCDTLWDEIPWHTGTSWAGTAPVPDGTAPERWCRISGSVIRDKTPGLPLGQAYTGLAMILRRDLPGFWAGIADAPLAGRERQVTGGLQALLRHGRLAVRPVAWTDTGDAAAYARAAASWSGYDWTKPGEVTWTEPGRVIKYRASQDSLTRLRQRHAAIAAAVPALCGERPHMLARDYVPGVTGYEAAARDPSLVPRLLDWAQENLWRPVRAAGTERACERFYKDKTLARIAMLRPGPRETAAQAAGRVDWAELASGCVPVTFHGDFNLGNVIVTPGGFTAIDWREDFAGQAWGDRRYDLGKLAAGMIVHWDDARRGDFSPWPAGRTHLDALSGWLGGMPHDVMVIAGLSLLNSAPLHAAPLDEVLAGRGAEMLAGL